MISFLFCVLAALHFLPAIAAISPEQLTRLYGISPEDKVMATLLQHRAILLGLVGAAFAAAAFFPELRWAGLIGGTLSMVLFLVIAALHGELWGSLIKISIADAAGLPVAALLFFLLARGS